MGCFYCVLGTDIQIHILLLLQEPTPQFGRGSGGQLTKFDWHARHKLLAQGESEMLLVKSQWIVSVSAFAT
jgi:hypothetical protein